MGNICSFCNEKNDFEKHVFLKNKSKKRKSKKSTKLGNSYVKYKFNENVDNLLSNTPLIVEHDRSYSY
jgi:hypothetical protein